MRLFGFIKLLALLLVVELAPLGAAAAQQASPPPSNGESDVFTYYYRDPRPERLVGLFDAFGKKQQDWLAYPPIAGFFAVVFAAQPGWIEKLVPAQLNASQAATIAAALQLSGQSATKNVQARLAQAETGSKLKAELSSLPNRLTNLKIATWAHLEILWGASFASGDGRYVLMIADFLARTANRSEAIALDVTRIAAGMSSGDLSGLAKLKEKYESELLVEMVYAGTAAWALTSNARQHGFVDVTVKRYISEHPGTWAAKVLAVLKAS
ncbi:MAG: hypothetical protein JWQ58_1984 [Reyranella sp.]|nr:hypothetical protein [Reyranella sp.]